MTKDTEPKIRYTPELMFKLYRPHGTIAFTRIENAILFWDRKLLMIHDDGHINLRSVHLGIFESYQVVEGDAFWEHKNSRVWVCYNVDLPDKVYLFKASNWDYIGEIEPELIMTKYNKKNITKVNRARRRKLLNQVKKRKQEDESIEFGLAVDSTSSISSPETNIVKALMKKAKKAKGHSSKNTKNIKHA